MTLRNLDNEKTTDRSKAVKVQMQDFRTASWSRGYEGTV